MFLFGVAGGFDDAAGGAGSGVAGGLGLEIVGADVEDDGAADDRVFAFEGDVGVDEFGADVSFGVDFDVSEIAGVAGVGIGGAVVGAVGIKMAAGGGGVGGGAVAVFVDMESAGAGFALDIGQLDVHADAFIDAGEGDGALGGVALGGGEGGDGFANLAFGSGGGVAGGGFGVRVVVRGFGWGGGFSGGFVAAGGGIARDLDRRDSGEEKRECDG